MSKARDIASAPIAPSTVSATELGYVDGVTSAIQTQIDSKIGSASAINPTIVDAKGDIIAASAADTVARLAVGANDTVLTADSSTATGLKWATPSAGGMTLIQETTASGLSSLSFSSIPSTYKHLLLTWNGVYHSTSGTVFNVRFNNNSGSVYAYRTNYSENSSFTETSSNGASQFQGSGSQAPFGRETTLTDLMNRAYGSIFIENYASTTKLKNTQGRWSWNWAGVASVKVFDYLGVFNDTTAITSVDIVRTGGTGTLENIANTSIRLYGIS